MLLVKINNFNQSFAANIVANESFKHMVDTAREASFIKNPLVKLQEGFCCISCFCYFKYLKYTYAVDIAKDIMVIIIPYFRKYINEIL